MIHESITKNQMLVIARLISRLTQAGIDYQISGGLAGNIHGSKWPLQDIDIEVTANDIKAVEKMFLEFVTRPLHHFEDREFRMLMINLRIDGVNIDINQAEDLYINVDGSWRKWDTDLRKAETVQWSGLVVRVQPLQDLIFYKKLLGRQADVADLSELP